MVSLIHEGVLELVRNQPAFVAQLLERLLGVHVPPFSGARLTDTTLNDLLPIEYHADAVVLLTEGAPVFGAIVEAQLAVDARKRFTWPLYAVAARARHECPFVVVVVTSDADVARWAARPIELGGDNLYRVHVIGPDRVPVISSAEEAKLHPYLSVLSAIAHGRDKPEVAIEIARAAGVAIEDFPEEQRVLYSALIRSALSDAARKAFEDMMQNQKSFMDRFYESEFARARAEGRAEGRAEVLAEAKAGTFIHPKAENILHVLTLRNLAVSAEQRQQIESCTDLAVLDRWFTLAVTAKSADELFAQP